MQAVFSADVITYRTEPGYSGALVQTEETAERTPAEVLPALVWLRHGTTMRPVKLISLSEMHLSSGLCSGQGIKGTRQMNKPFYFGFPVANGAAGHPSVSGGH